MTYIHDNFKVMMGDKIDPKKDYVLVRHSQVGHKATKGWAVCKHCPEVEDSTNIDGSTMVVMERNKGFENV
jgi:hypothetical protein